MVWDDPDGNKKHGEGGNSVDDEHKGEAGQVEQHRVEAGVDAAREHRNGQAEAATKGPGGGRREGKRVEKELTWRCLETSRCL